MPPPTFRRRSVEPPDLHQLEELVRTGTVPAGSTSDWTAVSAVLRRVQTPALPSELTGETAALSAFRQAQIGVPSRRPHQRPRMLSALITGKLAALALCTTAGVGTVATAAYANALPTPIQGFAHSAIGAPAPHESDNHAADPVVAPASAAPTSRRPEVTSTPTHHSELPRHSEPAAPTSTTSTHPTTVTTATTSAEVGPISLCLAYHAAVEHHTVLAAAMQARLVTLAGGTENIVAFCTKTLTTAQPTATHSEMPTATPTTAPHPVTTSVAVGLCNAYRHGTLPTQYIGRLNELAGGADHVSAFCATFPLPTTGPEPAHSSQPETTHAPADGPTQPPSSAVRH